VQKESETLVKQSRMKKRNTKEEIAADEIQEYDDTA